jgi:hypothetical protein
MITIDWNEPLDDGGCSVHGYSVHIDDGEAGEFKEANVQSDFEVRLLPSLRTMQIKRTSYNVGKTYRILVKAYNTAGSS